MKLRWKITLTVVTACCLNLLLLVGYYNIFISRQLASNQTALEQSLNQGELSDGDGKLYQGGSNPPH